MKTFTLEGVSVSFGSLHALNEVTLTMEAGKVHLLAGPNGSGKSTLIRVLLGLVRPSAGKLKVDGETRRVDTRFKEGLGYLPEAVAFSENLSGKQVLQFFARARKVKPSHARDVLRRVGLEHAGARAVRGYSRGMRQRLGLAVAIVGDPELLVLDEPTGGLDQEGLTVLWGIFEEWRERDKCILMASHDLALMERRVDNVCLLQAGSVLAKDTPSGLRERAQVPVVVHFSTPDETASKHLLEEVEKWGKGRLKTTAPRFLGVEVAPAELLGLLDLQARFPQCVESIRVEEPALDAIYDFLLDESADMKADTGQRETAQSEEAAE